jgi:hypothetical protein
VTRIAKIITAIYLLIAVGLILIPPLVYHYQYPTAGDDSAFHLEQIDKLNQYGISEAPESMYQGQNFTWLISFGGTDTFFVWFNFVALAAIAVMIWYFGYKLFGWHSGILASALSVFVCPAMLGFFVGGTIYNPINMWLFVLPAIMCFVLWAREGRTYYGMLSLMLFAIAGLFHGLTAMTVFVGMGMFLGVWVIYCGLRNRENLLRSTGFTAFFLITNLAIPYLLNPQFQHLLAAIIKNIGAISQSIGPMESPSRETVPALYWLFKLYSPWAMIVMLISVAIIWLNKKMIDKENGLVAPIFLCFGAVYSIGMFTKLFPESMRFGMDAGIMAGIATGCLAGQALKIRQNRLFTGSIYGIVGLAMIPAMIWLCGYTSCYTPADQQAVEFLNRAEGSTYTTSSQVQPKIYDRFVEGKEYTYPAGEYIVVRNKPMTCQCAPTCSWFMMNDHYPIENNMSEYDGMIVLGKWEYQGIVVEVLQGE